MINGRMLLRFCDVIFPTLIIKLGSIFDRDLKQLNKSDLRLTLDQIEDMKEIADEVAHFIFAKIDPLQAFILMMSINYWFNASTALELKKKEPTFVTLNVPRQIKPKIIKDKK